MYSIQNKRSEEKRNKKVIFLIVASLLISLASFLKQGPMYLVLVVGFSCAGLFIDPLLPLCISFATSAMAMETSAIISVGLQCLATFPALFFYVRGNNGGFLARDILLLLIAALSMLLSLLFGFEAQPVTLILQIMTLMLFMIASKAYTRGQNVLIVGAFILNCAFVVCVMLIQLATDSAVTLHNGRLTFNGSVRELSNVLAFPAFMLFSKFILPQKKTVGPIKFCLMLLLLVVLLGLLIASYSRGVIIAVFIAAAYLVLTQLGKLKPAQILLYVLVFSVLAVLFANADIDAELMTVGISDGNGRLDIWKFFWDKMGERGVVGYLFGFGPGDIMRISSGTAYSGYYAHSVLLDYIFSYGVLGGCLLAYMIFYALRDAVKHKNPLAAGLWILTVMMYSTHGNSASIAFHVYLGLVCSISLEDCRDNAERSARINKGEVWTRV